MYSKEPGPPKYIQFYWTKSELFDNISLRTTYRAKTIKNEKGEALLAEYAMSNDEKDAFTLFVKKAIYDVLDIVLKMTTGVESQPIAIDETIQVEFRSVPNAYGFKILDEEAYNINNLYTVDDGTRKYIDAHIMAAWYQLVGLKQEQAEWDMERDTAKTDLINNRLFQLKKAKLG